MKQLSALCAVFFLLTLIGCNKSSSPHSNNSSSPNDTSSNNNNNNNNNNGGNSDTISHVLTGGWSFQINGGPLYSGDVNTCLMTQGASAGQYQLVMSGPVANNWYSLGVEIYMPSTVPVVGSYLSYPSSNSQIQINYEYADNSFVFYSSDSITFNVVSYDPSTRAISATFYGNVNDGFGNISPVTNGTITGIVQK